MDTFREANDEMLKSYAARRRKKGFLDEWEQGRVKTFLEEFWKYRSNQLFDVVYVDGYIIEKDRLEEFLQYMYDDEDYERPYVDSLKHGQVSGRHLGELEED